GGGLRRARAGEGTVYLARLMAVDGLNVPSAGAKARELIVGDGEIGRTVNRDPVVVPQHDEFAEAEMASERNRLVADPLHEAAVADDRVSIVIDDTVAEARMEEALGDCHADGVSETLAERSGRRLDPRCKPIFRMA